MGPRVMRRLPKFVHGFIDRHGKPRFYFRRPGFESVALQGLPYSAEFMRAYEAALAGQPRPPATRAGAGTMAALALKLLWLAAVYRAAVELSVRLSPHHRAVRQGSR